MLFVEKKLHLSRGLGGRRESRFNVGCQDEEECGYMDYTDEDSMVNSL